MKNLVENQAIRSLKDIYNLRIINPCKNERYLHHVFTEMIRKEYPIIYKDLNKSKLHPEWATSNQYRLDGGKYKKMGISMRLIITAHQGLLILL